MIFFFFSVDTFFWSVLQWFHFSSPWLRWNSVPLQALKVIWRPSNSLSFQRYSWTTETRPHFNQGQVGHFALRINILHNEYTVKLLNQKCEKKVICLNRFASSFPTLMRTMHTFIYCSLSVQPPGGITRFCYRTQLPFEHDCPAANFVRNRERKNTNISNLLKNGHSIDMAHVTQF